MGDILLEYYCESCSFIGEALIPSASRRQEIKCPVCGEILKECLTPIAFRIRH